MTNKPKNEQAQGQRLCIIEPVECLLVKQKLRLIGSTAFIFSQNTLHDFEHITGKKENAN